MLLSWAAEKVMEMCNKEEANTSLQKKQQENQEEMERLEQMILKARRQEENFVEACRFYVQKVNALPYCYQGAQAGRCLTKMNDGLERGSMEIRNCLEEQRESLVRQRNACQEKREQS